jgi:hypothetical protein
MILILTFVLALIWGAVWAATLQHTAWGRFLAVRRTWIAVVIGVGGDLLLLLILLPVLVWLSIVALFALSSVGIIGRSLANEWREHRELLEGVDGNPYTDRQ